jgi:hypothetical protein
MSPDLPCKLNARLSGDTMKSTHLALFFVLLLTGCALTPKTEIYRERNFSLDSIKSMGVIKTETCTLMPFGVSQAVGGAVAGQFGIPGALVWTEVEYVKNKFDDSIDEEGIRLYQKSSSMLRERLSANRQIPFKETEAPGIDAISLSREIREIQLFGPKNPTPGEIAEFTRKHQLDYVLYSHSVGGINKTSRQLYLDTKWRIYNTNGRQPIAIFTRSVDQKASSDTLTTSAMTDKLLELFSENPDNFAKSFTNLASPTPPQ